MRKPSTCREAIKNRREARTILGGNGITLDYSPLRHASNRKSVRTYEGTDEVHTLILGSHTTGPDAFQEHFYVAWVFKKSNNTAA